MRSFCHATACRRNILMSFYDEQHGCGCKVKHLTGHACCDSCALQCRCESCPKKPWQVNADEEQVVPHDLDLMED